MLVFHTLTSPPPPMGCIRSQRRFQKRLGRRLEGVAEAVGGGSCRLQMPLKLALGVRGTVAGHRLGALEGRGGTFSPFNAPPPPPRPTRAPEGSGLQGSAA